MGAIIHKRFQCGEKLKFHMIAAAYMMLSDVAGRTMRLSIQQPCCNIGNIQQDKPHSF